MSIRRPVAVIGIGNPLRHDDGVGHALVSMLERLGGAQTRQYVDMIALDGEATRLIEAWRDRVLVMVVDAAQSGAPPGTIHHLVVGVDELPDWAAGASSHSAGLAEAIELASVLDRLPDELVIYGVEPGDLSLGEGLTEPVRAALPELAAAITVEHARFELSSLR